MVDNFTSYIPDKMQDYVIFDIGSRDCAQSIEFYNVFPNAKIYAFECNPNTIDICRKNIENYKDRITLIEGAVCDYDGEIDICYINENNYNFLLNIFSFNKIKLLFNNKEIIYNNKCNLEMYCVYHRIFYLRDDNFYFTFFGVNEIYPKEKEKEKNKNIILEYNLEKYNPFFQKRGYMETSAYLHIYWNKLYKNKDMIGFSQYDMKHNQKYENLKKDTIYLKGVNQNIVNNNLWNSMMYASLRNLDFLINSYSKFFSKNYSIKELENMPISLWQTNIYPVKIYEKLCGWLEVLVEEIFPWCNEPPHESHFGNIGGYTERALAIFNAFEIYEGTKYENLHIEHGVGVLETEHYGTSILNNYSQDVYTKYIENITGKHDDVNFCMFKSQCYLNGICYSCERINKNNKNGLYFKSDDCEAYYDFAFDIGGEDPRMVIINDKVYVIFTCESKYKNLNRGIAITEFKKYNPVVLKLKNNNYNSVEKNWAPFVKDNKLFFVYNYDPLIIINYDFNEEGLCDIVFIQDNIIMPIDINKKFLRGGSNLIHYKNEYYVGGCHSRIHYKGIYYNTHIILLDTIKWEIVYLSKPIMYNYNNNNNNNLTTIQNKNILNHTSILPYHSNNLHNIQAPCSLIKMNNKFLLTIDINCQITLLYELIMDLHINNKTYLQNEIESFTYLYNINLIDSLK